MARAAFFSLVVGLLGCAKAPPVPDRLAQVQPYYQNAFFLEFDHTGSLLNLTELERLTARLRESEDLERIFVLSLGWNNGIEDISNCVHCLDAYLEPTFSEARRQGRTVKPEKPGPTVVICVLWDASYSTVKRLFHDLLPSHALADALSFVPDKLLFPLSFWSKASLADKIGLEGLHESLDHAFATAYFEEAREPPPIFLIGHSFGCRVLSSLVHRDSEYRDHVRGVVLIQPALTEVHLPGPDEVRSPVVVTFSRHDHANSFLFPIGVSLFNSGASDLGAAVQTVVEERGLKRVTQLHQPAANMGFNLSRLPLSYVRTQAEQIITGPLDYLPDTAGRLPVVSCPVYLLGKLRGGSGWGEHRKGLFALGWVNDSVGGAPPILTPRPLPLPDRSRLEGHRGVRLAWEWCRMWGRTLWEFNRAMFVGYDRPERIPTLEDVLAEDFSLADGHLHVDCTEVVRHALPKAKRFRWDMNSGVNRLLFNWLNPVGAHADVLSPEIFALIDKVVGVEREALIAVKEPRS